MLSSSTTQIGTHTLTFRLVQLHYSLSNTAYCTSPTLAALAFPTTKDVSDRPLIERTELDKPEKCMYTASLRKIQLMSRFNRCCTSLIISPLLLLVLLQRAEAKLYLNALIMQHGQVADRFKQLTGEELLSMVQFGADRVFKSTVCTPYLLWPVEY
jgi:hypothetical protein